MNFDRAPSLGEEFFRDIGHPAVPDAPSCLLFAFPKSGSVLLNNIFFNLCSHSGRAWVNIPGYAFSRGLYRALGPDVAGVFEPTGYCYSGWREYPEDYEIPIITNCKSVLLVRDPRDMIVSHYFSIRHSHAAPEIDTKIGVSFTQAKNMADSLTIDEYVRWWAPHYSAMNKAYATLKTCHGLKTYRYEDVIYRKREWVDDMLNHLEWSIDPDVVSATLPPLDLLPKEENVNHHIRQVAPGDYKRKLQPDTIVQISADLADMIVEYGYEPMRPT